MKISLIILAALTTLLPITSVQEEMIIDERTEVNIPILMYHHLDENENVLNDFIVTPEKFENDMEELKELGYETVSYKEIYDFVSSSGDLPEKPIVVTFDDGYESNYTYAYPVLKELNMKASIAIMGAMVGEDVYNGQPSFRHFDYEQAKEMYESGLIEIQTHTYDMHNVEVREGIKKLENETEEEYIQKLTEDITRATTEIKENVGSDAYVFTYPYGKHDELTEKVLKELGFDITVTTEPGINLLIRGNSESLFKLKRYTISNTTDLEALLQ